MQLNRIYTEVYLNSSYVKLNGSISNCIDSYSDRYFSAALIL